MASMFADPISGGMFGGLNGGGQSGSAGSLATILGEYLRNVMSGQIAASGPLGQNFYDPNRSFAQNVLDPRAIESATDIALSLGAGPSKPFISKGTEAPLFDLSRIAEVPNMPQEMLPRTTPARGLPDRYKAVDTPETEERMISYFDQGAKMPGGAGLGWYNTMPLRERFQGQLGPEEGDQAWRKYFDYIAATSPQNPVPQNIRSGSYLYGLDRRGEPFPDNIIQNARGQWVWADDASKPPSPFGMLPTSMQNALKVRNEGGMDVLKNPKPPSFGSNLKGNYAPLTIDMHNLRALQYGDDAAGPGYGYLESLQQPWAEQVGVTPAQWQSSVWVGAGKDTGLMSPPEPFMATFESKIRQTAKAMGLSPDELLDRFIRGEIPGFK